jgi:uroporphyrin-III C-methyltransferase
MQENQLQPEPSVVAPPDAVPAKSAPQSSHAAYFGVAAVLALIALGLTVWQGYETRREFDGLRQEFARKLSDAEKLAKAGKQFAEQLRDVSREAGAKIAVLESRLAESQSQQIALESLYQDLSRNRDEWAYAEIEQTLFLANQQLQLAGNVKAALIALQAVEARLQTMNRPQLVALRKAINQDLIKLKALPLVDSVGIRLRLDNLVNVVDGLPLAVEGRPVPESVVASSSTSGEAPAWRRYLSELWIDVKQMVRVQRMDQPDVPLLVPSQAFFLRENLKLRLLSARLGLLAREQSSYNNDLKAADDWLARYFDTRDKSVATAMATLKGLLGSNVSIELPDIAPTMDALQSMRNAREREES